MLVRLGSFCDVGHWTGCVVTIVGWFVLMMLRSSHTGSNFSHFSKLLLFFISPSFYILNYMPVQNASCEGSLNIYIFWGHMKLLYSVTHLSIQRPLSPTSVTTTKASVTVELWAQPETFYYSTSLCNDRWRTNSWIFTGEFKMGLYFFWNMLIKTIQIMSNVVFLL